MLTVPLPSFMPQLSSLSKVLAKKALAKCRPRNSEILVAQLGLQPMQTNNKTNPGLIVNPIFFVKMAALAIALTAPLAGCKKPNVETNSQASPPSEQAVVEEKTNQEISGEVFITTQAGDTKRISGELVKFYPREQLEKSIQQSSKTAPTAMPPYDSEIAKVDQQISEINRITADVPFSQSIVDSKVRMLRLTDELKTSLTNLKNSWPHASYFFALFPKPEFEARTDSDGKFSVELPPGEWVMVVEASRNLGTSSREVEASVATGGTEGRSVAAIQSALNIDQQTLRANIHEAEIKQAAAQARADAAQRKLKKEMMIARMHLEAAEANVSGKPLIQSKTLAQIEDEAAQAEIAAKERALAAAKAKEAAEKAVLATPNEYSTRALARANQAVQAKEWLYWVYPVKNSSGNILSNFNLVTSGNADSLLNTKVARGEMPSKN